ncbi:MAG: GGDEF domain-containing protein [bacterium]
MLERLLAGTTLPSDVVNYTCVITCFNTGSIGGFISIKNGLQYFDTITGSLREKRNGAGEDSISMPDLLNIEIGKGLYLKKEIYVYHSFLDWYVGLDEPIVKGKNIIIENNIKIAYPIYYSLLKAEKKDDDRDMLTGLLTRKRFYKDLNAYVKNSISTSSPLYIFYIDFNNFKTVNDNFGHEMGDRVLISVSAEMRNVFLGYGNLYRIGGDEFCALAFGIDFKIANTLTRRLEKVSEQAPCGLLVNLSVGVKKLNTDNMDINKFFSNTDKIIKDFIGTAEELMYKKKKNKQNIIIACDKCVFNNSVQ